MKRLAVAITLVIGFYIGFGVVAHAWPGVDNRSAYHGYFLNDNDTYGSFVIPGGIPSSVNTATEFINFIKGKIASGTSRERVGANFIVDYMLGGPPWSRERTNTAKFNNIDLPLWESEVRAYAPPSGDAEWFSNYRFTVNSFWQGTNGGGSDPNDDAFYYETDTQPTIVFRHPVTNKIVATIKRSCANIVTSDTAPPGMDAIFTMTGHTDVVGGVTTAQPGDSVVFQHHVQNLASSLTAAPSVTWTAEDGPSSTAPSGLGTVTGGPHFYAVGQDRLIQTDTLNIPSNAAAGTKYCRRVGYDPVNNNATPTRNGRGAEKCVTVVVPAKLKAVMTANPRSIAPGGSTSFTPAVSVQSAGSPVTVNCTITRTAYPASGGSSSLGSVPCVDTSGNANITVSNGVTSLRANSYTAPDTLDPGSRVCDVMTITVPAADSYFTDPVADRTATDCVTIVKTPYVTFMGGDVWAGGDFSAVNPACNRAAKITTTARQLSDGSLAGSGVEYAAFALGKISQFGSAARALLNTSVGSSALTFSNADINNLGFYGAAQHCIEDYVAKYSSATAMAGGTIDVGGQPSQTRHITGAATFHGAMPAGSLQIYLVDGAVTIDGPITYPASYGSVSQIPSLVIISKTNVQVAAAVTTMDGVYVARGTFYTCFPKIEPAVLTTCANKLTVNGAVIAGNLDLFRTAGASGATPALRKQPAETFVTSTELYLRNAFGGTSQPTLRVTNLRELPARF